MSLKTSIVPILNKMMANVKYRLAHHPQTNIMPRHSRSISINTILPKLSNLR